MPTKEGRFTSLFFGIGPVGIYMSFNASAFGVIRFPGVT